MSMKSFDKLCRDILIGDPYAEREIYDERQKLFRLRLSVEALLIFGGLVTANCIVMEFFRKWGETEIFTILLIATFCAVYWVIRCASKGCLIGTNGKRLTRNCGIGAVAWLAFDLIEPIDALVRGDRAFFIVNGALSNELLYFIGSVLFAVGGVVMLWCVHRENVGNRREKK